MFYFFLFLTHRLAQKSTGLLPCLTKKKQKLKPSRLLPHKARRPGVWAGLPYTVKERFTTLVFSELDCVFIFIFERMKNILVLLLLVGHLCIANMASPLQEGTISSSAFSSKDIDILKEKINLLISKDFTGGGYYTIEYFIKTQTEGKQIPLLFHAADYSGDFKVWVDGKEIQLLDIPDGMVTSANSPFEKFSNSFEHNSGKDGVAISWSKGAGFVYQLSDLKYFEIDLTKGEHKILVQYAAKVWTYHSEWVNEYSFRYSLSPAKFWKSFGSLEITVDASNCGLPLTSNLGTPTLGKLDSIAYWKFDKLPQDFFEICNTPHISPTAKTMIAINPLGLTVLISIIISLLHIISIKRRRKAMPDDKNSWVVIVGSIVNPFLFIIIYMLSFSLIDKTIGPDAANRHGYTFLAIIFYPILLPIYWLLMRFVDRTI
jgi:hypothetical protein